MEGLKCGGKFALQNQLGLYLGEICISKSIGLAYNYVSNLREVFIETRCEDADMFLEFGHQNLKLQITLLKTQYSVQK